MNVERSTAQRQETPALNGSLRRTVHAALFKGDRYFVADCLEIPVVTQGLTVDETLSNLQEAVALHMEDEDLEEIGPYPQSNNIGDAGIGICGWLDLGTCRATKLSQSWRNSVSVFTLSEEATSSSDGLSNPEGIRHSPSPDIVRSTGELYAPYFARLPDSFLSKNFIRTSIGTDYKCTGLY